MMTHIKGNTIGICVFVLSLLVSTTSLATHAQVYSGHGGYGHGGYGHGHGGYGYGNGGYYNGGGFYFGGGGWGGPNLVINVPAPRYYAPPVCENVQVCDTYTDECWIESRCG
jgi:hypothetical protein